MSEKRKIITFSAIGVDSPGLVSKITTEIFQMSGNIIDVEEICRRGLFSIFLIIDFSASEKSIDEILHALKPIENETGLKVILGIRDEDEVTDLTEKEDYMVTVLGIDQPGIIANISTFFRKYNINIKDCRMIARGKFFAMEMVIDTRKIITEPPNSHNEAIEKMKGELKDICTGLNQSVVIQSEDIYKRAKKLVVFDVESTLIQDLSLKNFLESIAERVKPIGSKIESEHNNQGKIQALVKNARVLKGMPVRDFEKFCEILQLNTGTLELIQILKSMGFKIALLSSGFDFFIKRILDTASVDYAFSNTLKADEHGIIVGELGKPVITNTTKKKILEFIMNLENISRDQVVAVGDGSTISHFRETVGLSISFKPDETGMKTDGILRSDRIISILYFLGISKAELDKYLKKNS
ncbi:MAG: HAD-IB family phosphatase [Deltaproteobacteria bacterium]|nr:HAD-IB family phosphatase [Deltaproteobacteria bacterium]